MALQQRCTTEVSVPFCCSDTSAGSRDPDDALRIQSLVNWHNKDNTEKTFSSGGKSAMTRHVARVRHTQPEHTQL